MERVSLYDTDGRRKYLNRVEREAFRQAADSMPPHVRTFCLTLLYTGARISEVLQLVPSRVDVDGGLLTFESLKKRRRGVYRSIPVPPSYLGLMEETHYIRERTETHPTMRLWPVARSTASLWVKEVMDAAGISGKQASPRGLRHSFAIWALQRGVPINLVQKWLGHANLSTTAIYLQAVGEEEQNFARRMWEE